MSPKHAPSSRCLAPRLVGAVSLCVALLVGVAGCHQEANQTAKRVYPTVPDIFESTTAVGAPSDTTAGGTDGVPSTTESITIPVPTVPVFVPTSTIPASACHDGAVQPFLQCLLSYLDSKIPFGDGAKSSYLMALSSPFRADRPVGPLADSKVLACRPDTVFQSLCVVANMPVPAGRPTSLDHLFVVMVSYRAAVESQSKPGPELMSILTVKHCAHSQWDGTCRILVPSVK